MASEIEDAITEMLHESTGVAICDSGGSCGRHWQKNQLIEDFGKLPRFSYTIYDDGHIEGTINIYHFLTERLEVNQSSNKLNDMLNLRLENESYESPVVAIQELIDCLEDGGWEKVYGENSYNRESQLSQVIQYDVIKSPDGEFYVILQIHNGCDVRGGYTNPRVFKMKCIDWEYDLLSDQYMYAGCDCTDATSDDCGYHWYDEFPEFWELRKLDGKNRYWCTKCTDWVEIWG